MKKTSPLKLQKLNIAITSHIFATGPALELESFLKDKVNSLIFIGHPFIFRERINSFIRIYSKGKLTKNTQAYPWKLSGPLQYLKDATYTFYWILTSSKKIDYYFGSDGFMAFLGLLLKKVGKVSNVVLYTIDFMPTRFENPLLNNLYHYFDKQCLKNCKIIWNLSDKMAHGREEYYQEKKENFAPQLTVPLGIWLKRIPKVSFEKRNRYQIVFMGHLLKKQGLDIVIEGLTKIAQKFPRVKLLIIGTGEYENKLKLIVSKNKLDKYVEFTGYVENHEKIEKLLSESMIAVATYIPDPESFTYFADPGKIKNYLAAGLPVILTDVPPIAKEISDKKCAFIVDYNAEEFARIAMKLLTSPSLLKNYGGNAFKFAKSFDWEMIFPEALEKTIN